MAGATVEAAAAFSRTQHCYDAVTGEQSDLCLLFLAKILQVPFTLYEISSV